LTPKKHKLSVSLDEDFGLLGIASDEPDYKLCWLINDRLQTSFVKIDDLILFNRKAELEQLFSIFLYSDENTMMTYRLIRNRSENGFFIPELKNIDYVLHIQGEITTDDLDKLIKNMGRVSSIRFCVPVDLGRIKDKERLHLW